MNPSFRVIASLLGSGLLFLLTPPALSQQWAHPEGIPEPDPCGLPDTTATLYRVASITNWGYGYDSLRADIQRWGASPFVRVDSIGASVLGRAIYLLTVEDPSLPSLPRQRVWIHARTHPNEVQGTWVTNQLIAQLLGESPLAQRLRERCVFNIVPMINPDGVELRYSRENAHMIDIESNWAVVPGEPEVQLLRAQFTQMMALTNPIRIALNIHSALACKRYFVYHAPGGTSPLYASIEEDFIGKVRQAFPGGIEPYTYYVSWATTASRLYPESWFWYNHAEDVLALTYEDKNCVSAGGYDSTAHALLQGIGDYLGVTSGTEAVETTVTPGTFTLFQNYPNPFNPETVIRYVVPAGNGRVGGVPVRMTVFDLLGHPVALLVDGTRETGIYEVRFDASGLPGGVYFCRLSSGTLNQTRKMILMK
jgi:hypothetical protein